jgi:hypothetical protein
MAFLRLFQTQLSQTRDALAWRAAAACVLAGWAVAPSIAQAGNGVVYRCSGSPTVYTSDPRMVRGGRCEALGRKQVIRSPAPVVSTMPPSAPAAGVSAVSTAAPSRVEEPSASPQRVTARVQQQRDSDRVRVLEDELARERDKLVQLRERMFAASRQPNAPTGINHELQQAVLRAEADVAALSRELYLASR